MPAFRSLRCTTLPISTAFWLHKSTSPGLPNVGVMDTSFHQTMPERAYTYAVPRELRKKYAFRRYGFHGTSMRYVAPEAARILGKPLGRHPHDYCHLGNGASITAIKNGKSVDTSMGFTPIEGFGNGYTLR